MGLLAKTQAWSVAVSVVMVSVSVGSLLFASLAPKSTVSPYMVAQGLSLLAAVAIHSYGMWKYENGRSNMHKQLASVDPKNCPDYWTSKFDSCSNTSFCSPWFETGDPEYPRVYMNGDKLVNLKVSEYSSKGPEEICVENEARAYPWTEVTNSCDARGRAV